jgi:nucleoside-diphosphate-sugar epimerase
MKVVVIRGSSLIGSKLVDKLREAGHDPIPASPTLTTRKDRA